MQSINRKFTGQGRVGGAQRGALTVFTAVLILFLMTVMVIYATRVGIFETRISGNDVRQKQAFHAAEAAIEEGIMYLLNNTQVIVSSQSNAFPDGDNDPTTGRDGWFDPNNLRWGTCSATELAMADHPCGGDFPLPLGAYFYDDPSTNTGVDSLPVNTTEFASGTTARLTAVMCFVDLTNPAGGCGTAPDPTAEADVALVLWMLGYGYSDCTDVTDIDTCRSVATVAKPVSNYSNLKGTPAVPLVTKSTFPPNGTAEIVGNPNGGGVGVPLTAWLNENPSCPPAGGSSITSSGSWQTCEYEEWYHVSDYPEGVECTDNNCFCGSGGNNTDEFLSWRKANDTNIGIDIVQDDEFPCDLFEFYFGYPRSQYQLVKNGAQIVDDCSGLGPNSSGLIWAEGATCRINGNTTVGSPTNPVILVSAAGETDFQGGAVIFGLVYIFDGEVTSADVSSTGGATIYGAMVVDAGMERFQGTFQIVYAGGVLGDAAGIAGLGGVNGGWRDFGLPDIAW